VFSALAAVVLGESLPLSVLLGLIITTLLFGRELPVLGGDSAFPVRRTRCRPSDFEGGT
jgi:hypothetical protein